VSDYKQVMSHHSQEWSVDVYGTFHLNRKRPSTCLAALIWNHIKRNISTVFNIRCLCTIYIWL